MNIFESFSTILLDLKFQGSWGNSKNWMELKNESP
jgi:hypothetical protein